MATANILQLEEATKVYGQGDSAVCAVDRASLTLERGRFFILMGPSGSGKTTLLMLMGCLLKPSTGRVSLFGQPVSEMNERQLPFIRRRYIGFIFQSFNLFPALTAQENVEATLNLKGYRGEAARQRARELLERLGLEKRLRHLPEDLSGGEKQRVAVARALAGDPAVVLADEPTGMLDSKSGRLIVQILHELARREERLVFMVSHDTRILDLADKILYMDDGHLRDS